MSVNGELILSKTSLLALKSNKTMGRKSAAKIVFELLVDVDEKNGAFC